MTSLIRSFTQVKHFETRLVNILDASTDLNQIKQTHARILYTGLYSSCYVISKLIRVLTKLTVPVETYPLKIFNQVTNPNAFLYNSVIRGFAVQGKVGEAVRFYGVMRQNGVCPVSFTFSALFKACIDVFDVGLGRQIHGQVFLIGGFDSDLHVFNSLIGMYVQCGSLGCGRKLFDEMPRRDVISWTEMIVAYTKSGDMGAAGGLFCQLPVKDTVAWTIMVTGFAQNAKPCEAIEWFDRMMGAGVGIDDVSLMGVVSACAQLGASKYADWIGDAVEKFGFGNDLNVMLGSALIDMYSKCGRVEDAYEVFNRTKEKNVYTYSSMISGFAIHGRIDDAMRVFSGMVETDTKPNHVTFIGLLTACSHAGKVEQGWEIFTAMEKIYSVEPTADHFTCIVDMLGRVGRIEEAYELVKTMPVTPHGGVWGALLGACRMHKNPDIAEIAASHLFELEPHGIGNYIILCNIYASRGMWDDVLRIRKLMKSRGIKKNPACSWIETEKGVVHEFFAGELTHPRSTEILQALEELLESLRSDGYRPNLTCVPYKVSDEEKNRILLMHSEKLALAFALISIDPHCMIRIMKNLRICEDCHLVMCTASKFTKREIVLRDNMRFHHFKEGACSCGNFW